jgi:hypothetical protein
MRRCRVVRIPSGRFLDRSATRTGERCRSDPADRSKAFPPRSTQRRSRRRNRRNSPCRRVRCIFLRCNTCRRRKTCRTPRSCGGHFAGSRSGHHSSHVLPCTPAHTSRLRPTSFRWSRHNRRTPGRQRAISILSSCLAAPCSGSTHESMCELTWLNRHERGGPRLRAGAWRRRTRREGRR